MIRHIHVSECDSTQEVLKEQLKLAPSEEPVLVSCDVQRQGRGRGSNIWTSLPDTLCLSLTIEPHIIPSFTALELSVLIAHFFKDQKLTLKWPNDLWNNNQKKCCGILVQNFSQIMVAGIGLNLYSDHDDYGGIYPAKGDQTKKDIANHLADYICTNRFQNTSELINSWESLCHHMNEKVVIVEGSERTEGIFMGLGSHGQALLKTADGQKHLYNGSLRKI